MSVVEAERNAPQNGWQKSPVFYGWVIVLMSAVAMVATFPGRSHGLGTITERLVDDPEFLKDPDLFTGLPLLTGPALLHEARERAAKVEDRSAGDQTAEGRKAETDPPVSKIVEQKNADNDWKADLAEFKNRMRYRFGGMNLWATLLGALFCIPCGNLIDRYGARINLAMVTMSLGGAVVLMTRLTDYWSFFIALVLTRGLGQSALSVISLAMPGKWFSRRLGSAMSIYTVLMAVGFISTFQWVGLYKDTAWQTIWSTIGWILVVGIAPLSWLLVRNTPEDAGLYVDGDDHRADSTISATAGHTIGAALAEPAFWAFALATSMYGLVSSGVQLFNQDILSKQGFGVDEYYRLLKISTGLGLAGNFLGGFLAQRISLRHVMALSMTLLAAALLWMPCTKTPDDLTVYAIGMSLGGGMMTVVFFTAFGQVFGRLHLGQIQGIAQMLTVFASAAGQTLVPYCYLKLESYRPFFYASSAVVLAMGVWTLCLRLPKPNAAGDDPS
jgi:MFS family permease